jgi:Tol biopolymer transport system component
VLYNLDGDSCMFTRAGGKGPVPITTDDLRRLVEEIAQEGSRVDTVLVCINAQVMYYPTEVGTMRGDLSTPDERARWPESERQRSENLRRFFEAGVDPYAVILAEARRRGREALLSFRMNDDHGNDFLRTRFWADHPDCRLGKGALDFGRPEVRDHVFLLIEEAVKRYDCDGIELDFNRFPTFFRTGAEDERVAAVNALVERVRRMLNDVGRARGRKLVLGVRVPSNYGRTPPTPATCRALGCDPAAWAQKGWVDFVSVSEFLFERGDLPIAAWKEAIRDVPVYGGIECTRGGSREQYLTPGDYLRAARRLREGGADGVYLFNFFTTREYGPDSSEPPFGVLRELGPLAEEADEPLIGYTVLRTDLPGGRHANVSTMRATVISANGTGTRTLAEDLAREPDSWTQFAGWSPDGRQAIVGRGWENPENARWEEEHKAFRFTPEGWLYDMNLVDLADGAVTNVTAVDRVSFHNTGLFFWPGDPSRLGFQTLIGGNSHPFRMDRDGRNKHDLTEDSKEFAYGFSASPDGRRIAYHKSYRIFVADPDGSNAQEIATGQPFNFAPQWSPDSRHLLFVAGEHYDCHPHVVSADGTGLRKLADRGGHRGVVEFLDVPDFHGGSSDVPAWSADGTSVFYTARVGETVELFRIPLDGPAERLTRTPAGSLHYHPTPSPDGRRLAYGSKREGVRQLYLMDLGDHAERRLTDMKFGHAAMWPHWQPRPVAPGEPRGPRVE